MKFTTLSFFTVVSIFQITMAAEPSAMEPMLEVADSQTSYTFEGGRFGGEYLPQSNPANRRPFRPGINPSSGTEFVGRSHVRSHAARILAGWESMIYADPLEATQRSEQNVKQVEQVSEQNREIEIGPICLNRKDGLHNFKLINGKLVDQGLVKTTK